MLFGADRQAKKREVPSPYDERRILIEKTEKGVNGKKSEIQKSGKDRRRKIQPAP